MSWSSVVESYLLTNWMELAAAMTTAVGIWLTARRIMWCWPVVLMADVLYIMVYRHVMLLSDALLQVFFIGFTLYGWWHWWRGVQDDGEVRIVPLQTHNLLLGLAVGAAGCAALGALAVRLGAALPYLDAALASYSLIGSWWQARKHIANWWLWIVVDTVYVAEYIYKSLWLTAVLYAGLVVLAFVGLRDWRRAPVTASDQIAA